LLTRGYTNREIATSLVISVKTASVHVSRILHKLGAPNRWRRPRSRTGSPHRPAGEHRTKPRGSPASNGAVTIHRSQTLVDAVGAEP